MSEPTNTRKIQIRVRDIELGMKEVRATLIVSSVVRLHPAALQFGGFDVMRDAKESVRRSVLHALFGSIREQAKKLYLGVRRSFPFYSYKEAEAFQADAAPLLNAGDDWQVEEVSTVRFACAPMGDHPMPAKPEEYAETPHFDCDECGRRTMLAASFLPTLARCRCGNCGKVFEVEFYEAEEEKVGQGS